MDENGYLRLELSSDAGIHLNEDGEAIWIRSARAFAAKQMRPDAIVEYPPVLDAETEAPDAESSELSGDEPDAAESAELCATNQPPDEPVSR